MGIVIPSVPALALGVQQDGWRHLLFVLMYSPRWLFLYPGLA
ncbi:hypothetical protein PN487_15040 [Microcystis aeruginosa CS-556/03]|nr:hypothetical protein [Microcystis aeruginosa]MDB9417878.1 hypothetical protein [Microcystis aeruginosa CS-556/03]